MKCSQCQRVFPQRLVALMVAAHDGVRHDEYLCPLCALKKRNAMHGLPEGTPFQGEIAQEMWEEAKQMYPEG